jgi:RNA polymerase sigma-70 factor (ECF subfamily)
VDFVWKNLHRLGVPSADVPDMLQEVFMVVHRKLDTFDGCSKMSSWLFGISMRVAASHRRRAHIRRERPCEELPQQGHSDTPEAAAIARDERTQLDAILNTLDGTKRAILVMYELEELSCAEISAQLGIPEGTVYSRLHHAREALKRSYARHQAKLAHTRGAA